MSDWDYAKFLQLDISYDFETLASIGLGIRARRETSKLVIITIISQRIQTHLEVAFASLKM